MVLIPRTIIFGHVIYGSEIDSLTSSGARFYVCVFAGSILVFCLFVCFSFFENSIYVAHPLDF